jgi:hypothetical protein
MVRSMTTLRLQFAGSEATLAEMHDLLAKNGVESQRATLFLNAAGAGSVDLLLVVAGSGITLIAQAVVAYMRRKSGQRKIIVQWLDESEERLKRVEVETPRLEEIEELLKKAERVFAVDSSDEKT